MLAERCDGGVVPHRERGLLPAARGGTECERQVLARVGVGDLAALEVGGDRSVGPAGRAGDAMGPEPRRVRTLAGHASDGVALQAPGSGVEQHHLPRAELSSADRAVPGRVNRPRLRCASHEAVVAQGIAERAQAVPIQRRADREPVGEHERGRPVPRLHQRLVPPVERPHLLAQVRIGFPGRGDQHGHGMADVAPTTRPLPREELHGLVEHRGVRTVLVEHGRVQLLVRGVGET